MNIRTMDLARPIDKLPPLWAMYEFMDPELDKPDHPPTISEADLARAVEAELAWIDLRKAMHCS